jgi:hypothetical protein
MSETEPAGLLCSLACIQLNPVACRKIDRCSHRQTLCRKVPEFSRGSSLGKVAGDWLSMLLASVKDHVEGLCFNPKSVSSLFPLP